MINIAICDDDEIFCSSVKQMILDYKTFNTNIKMFNESTQLCEYIKNHSNFDIIFLDIEFNKQNFNGIQVGNFIRNELQNQVVQIVYISANEEYSMQLFDFRPLNFLIKPIDKEKIFKVLDTYKKIIDNNVYIKYFEFKSDNSNYRLPITDIMYFFSEGHKITIVTCKNEKYRFYGKLKTLQNNELFKDFISIHKSFFINLDYVLKYTYTEIMMQDNQILPISRTNRKSVHEKMVLKSFG